MARIWTEAAIAVKRVDLGASSPAERLEIRARITVSCSPMNPFVKLGSLDDEAFHS